MSAPYDYQALYLHIPFCAARCFYCDFETIALSKDDPLLDNYTKDLLEEIQSASQDGLLAGIKTVYIGGGTPTFIGSRRLIEVVDTVSSCVSLNSDIEFTVEANPESLSRVIMHDLAAKGVNRISLGVQSFDTHELEALGRIHDEKMARSAIQNARDSIENVSIDLMCGIPLQTDTSWLQTLEVAISSGVTHVSVYPLTIEEKTPFGRSIDEGLMAIPDEDDQAEFMEVAAEMLLHAGFERYEVASYAQAGYECKHNIAYWTGLPYLGLGKGAAGMREHGDTRERLVNGEVVETFGPQEALLEDIMLGMRMSRGVALGLVKQAGAFAPRLLDTFEELIALGLARYEDGRYRPTSRGWLLGNELYGRIWANQAP